MSGDGSAARERLRLRHWARIGHLLWRTSPSKVIGLAVATAGVSVSPAVSLALTERAVQAVADAVAGQDLAGSTGPILRIGALLVLVSVLAHLCGAWMQYLDAVLRLELTTSLGEQVMRKGTRMELQDYEDAESYDRLQRAFQESGGARVHQVFGDTLEFARELIVLVSVAAVLFSWNPWVAVTILVSPIPSAMSQMLYGRKMYEIEYGRAADQRRLTYYQFLTTTDHSFKEVRLFGLGPFLIESYRAVVRRFLTVDRGIVARQSLWLGGLGLISVVTAAAAIVMAMFTTLGSGRIGQLAGCLQAVGLVHASAHTMLLGLAMLAQNALFVGNLFALLDAPDRQITGGDRRFPSPLRGGVEFRDVSFAYPGTDTPVLDRVSFTLPAGSCTALVGQNGAGKTTLVKLLTRLYEPSDGQILVDGVPIEQFDLDDLRRNMGVIFQDYIKYEMSVRHNIGFGCVDALDDDERVHRAAQAGGAAPVVAELDGGYEAVLGRHFEDGNQLSGGQWQKIALARAFMREAPILVLDEPTAAIDAQAEAEIFSRLRDIAGTATSLLIAHRFSTVRMADNIIVIENGALVEEGTHAELLAADGHYAYLFNLQAAGYLPEPSTR